MEKPRAWVKILYKFDKLCCEFYSSEITLNFTLSGFAVYYGEKQQQQTQQQQQHAVFCPDFKISIVTEVSLLDFQPPYLL